MPSDTTKSFPRAILHVDGDAFFASCEQAVNPALRGKPVITGKERGIASAVSYEAKAFGIKRGMPIHEIKRLCPDIIYLPSDYETYSLFSQRMYSIVRRYTPLVEEYGIDECFAEITGLNKPLHLSYQEIALTIKDELMKELGISFSVGLGPSKVLAKAASKWNKPNGFVVIEAPDIPVFLRKLPLEKVWGIGPQTTAKLARMGLTTALELIEKPQWWIEEHLHKPFQEIWHELRGKAILPIITEAKRTYDSISKTKTFTPATSNREYILAQFSKNTENACIKARRYNLGAQHIYFYLRTKDFRHRTHELKLPQPLMYPGEIVRHIGHYFDAIYRSHELYRATGVILANLTPTDTTQMDLFNRSQPVQKARDVYRVVDEIDKRYGKHTVFLGSSYYALKQKQYAGDRNVKARRSTMLFEGEGERRRVGLPYLGEVI